MATVDVRVRSRPRRDFSVRRFARAWAPLVMRRVLTPPRVPPRPSRAGARHPSVGHARIVRVDRRLVRRLRARRRPRRDPVRPARRSTRHAHVLGRARPPLPASPRDRRALRPSPVARDRIQRCRAPLERRRRARVSRGCFRTPEPDAILHDASSAPPRTPSAARRRRASPSPPATRCASSTSPTVDAHSSSKATSDASPPSRSTRAIRRDSSPSAKTERSPPGTRPAAADASLRHPRRRRSNLRLRRPDVPARRHRCRGRYDSILRSRQSRVFADSRVDLRGGSASTPRRRRRRAARRAADRTESALANASANE